MIHDGVDTIELVTTKDDWGQLKAAYNFQNMYPAIIML